MRSLAETPPSCPQDEFFFFELELYFVDEEY
jgi:hypothetical protein